MGVNDTGSYQNLESHLVAQLGIQRDFFWHRLRWRAVYPFLSDSAPGYSLIDVGAGAGFVGEYLKANRPSAEYVFIEPIEALRNELRTRYSPEQDATDRSEMQADDAVLLDVLEHQRDDIAFLKEITCRFRKRLIVTVPAHDWLWSSWDERLGHYRRYSRSQLVTVAERSGLRCVECRYLFPEMVIPGLFRRFMASNSKSEFPKISPAMNQIAYRLGSLTQNLLSRSPTGTSVLGVFEKAD